jgi:hypothetical protein
VRNNCAEDAQKLRAPKPRKEKKDAEAAKRFGAALDQVPFALSAGLFLLAKFYKLIK